MIIISETVNRCSFGFLNVVTSHFDISLINVNLLDLLISVFSWQKKNKQIQTIHQPFTKDNFYSIFSAIGNPRGHENPFLLSFGILWFRWHNLIADRVAADNPSLKDEQIFNIARKRVIAQYQVNSIYLLHLTCLSFLFRICVKHFQPVRSLEEILWKKCSDWIINEKKRWSSFRYIVHYLNTW